MSRHGNAFEHGRFECFDCFVVVGYGLGGHCLYEAKLVHFSLFCPIFALFLTIIKAAPKKMNAHIPNNYSRTTNKNHE
jgi:hypothetical protein